MVFHADYEREFRIFRATNTSNQWEDSFETLATVQATTRQEALQEWINAENPTAEEIAEAQVVGVDHTFA